jgi:hypothetical protein
MTSKELKEIIEPALQEGQSYQSIYDDLNAKYPGREIDLVRLVSAQPNLDQRIRFKIPQMALIGSIVAIVLVLFVQSIFVLEYAELVSFIAMVGLAIFYMVLASGIIRWNPRYFMTAGYAGYGLATIASRSYWLGNITSNWIWLDAGLFALIGFLGSIPGHQLGGKYKTSSQQYKDAKGQIRARHTIRFKN